MVWKKCHFYPKTIGCTLSIAPYAILYHLDITLSAENANDVSNHLEMLPILFTSHQNYKNAIASFVDSCKKEKCESDYANNTDYEVPSSCVVEKNRAGEFLFCEAVKVDDLLSDADLKKNARNTISLLAVLFEDPSEAQNWYDDISKKLCRSDPQIIDMSSLFNNTNEWDDLDKFRVGQKILINCLDGNKKLLNC
jgi:hypothetical protein